MHLFRKLLLFTFCLSCLEYNAQSGRRDFLYKASRDGHHPLYLFGSTYATDINLLPLSDSVFFYFNRSSVYLSDVNIKEMIKGTVDFIAKSGMALEQDELFAEYGELRDPELIEWIRSTWSKTIADKRKGKHHSAMPSRFEYFEARADYDGKKLAGVMDRDFLVNVYFLGKQEFFSHLGEREKFDDYFQDVMIALINLGIYPDKQYKTTFRKGHESSLLEYLDNSDSLWYNSVLRRRQLTGILNAIDTLSLKDVTFAHLNVLYLIGKDNILNALRSSGYSVELIPSVYTGEKLGDYNVKMDKIPEAKKQICESYPVEIEFPFDVVRSTNSNVNAEEYYAANPQTGTFYFLSVQKADAGLSDAYLRDNLVRNFKAKFEVGNNVNDLIVQEVDGMQEVWMNYVYDKNYWHLRTLIKDGVIALATVSNKQHFMLQKPEVKTYLNSLNFISDTDDELVQLPIKELPLIYYKSNVSGFEISVPSLPQCESFRNHEKCEFYDASAVRNFYFNESDESGKYTLRIVNPESNVVFNDFSGVYAWMKRDSCRAAFGEFNPTISRLDINGIPACMFSTHEENHIKGYVQWYAGNSLWTLEFNCPNDYDERVLQIAKSFRFFPATQEFRQYYHPKFIAEPLEIPDECDVFYDINFSYLETLASHITRSIQFDDVISASRVYHDEFELNNYFATSNPQHLLQVAARDWLKSQKFRVDELFWKMDGMAIEAFGIIEDSDIKVNIHLVFHQKHLIIRVVLSPKELLDQEYIEVLLNSGFPENPEYPTIGEAHVKELCNYVNPVIPVSLGLNGKDYEIYEELLHLEYPLVNQDSLEVWMKEAYRSCNESPKLFIRLGCLLLYVNRSQAYKVLQDLAKEEEDRTKIYYLAELLAIDGSEEALRMYIDVLQKKSSLIEGWSLWPGNIGVKKWYANYLEKLVPAIKPYNATNIWFQLDYLKWLTTGSVDIHSREIYMDFALEAMVSILDYWPQFKVKFHASFAYYFSIAIRFMASKGDQLQRELLINRLSQLSDNTFSGELVYLKFMQGQPLSEEEWNLLTYFSCIYDDLMTRTKGNQKLPEQAMSLRTEDLLKLLLYRDYGLKFQVLETRFLSVRKDQHSERNVEYFFYESRNSSGVVYGMVGPVDAGIPLLVQNNVQSAYRELSVPLQGTALEKVSEELFSALRSTTVFTCAE